jgi:hypothetical protein
VLDCWSCIWAQGWAGGCVESEELEDTRYQAISVIRYRIDFIRVLGPSVSSSLASLYISLSCLLHSHDLDYYNLTSMDYEVSEQGIGRYNRTAQYTSSLSFKISIP